MEYELKLEVEAQDDGILVVFFFMMTWDILSFNTLYSSDVSHCKNTSRMCHSIKVRLPAFGGETDLIN